MGEEIVVTEIEEEIEIGEEIEATGMVIAMVEEVVMQEIDKLTLLVLLWIHCRRCRDSYCDYINGIHL